ncbi:MAG: rod shape-determining protein MreC [Candidatus Omnitrophota bacterium]|nr:rod shape-determining protein MreC [Candidatus Omnitrophota bacterium]
MLRFNKKTISIIFLLFLIPILTVLDPALFNNKIKLSIISAFKPVLTISSGIASKLKQSSRRLRGFQGLLKQKNMLEQRVIELTGEVIELKESSIENERLKKLLLFKKQTSQKAIPAQVITKDSTNWHKTVVINKGVKQGIKKDMPVVTSQGLVGKVIQTGEGVSQVMLMLDPNLKISGLIQRNREQGIIEGSSFGLCRMRYFSLDTDVKSGDVVISSGLGGIYPKGLIVGKVRNLEKDTGGLYSYAWVEPIVDFSKLEEVLCLELK